MTLIHPRVNLSEVAGLNISYATSFNIPFIESSEARYPYFQYHGNSRSGIPEFDVFKKYLFAQIFVQLPKHLLGYKSSHSHNP